MTIPRAREHARTNILPIILLSFAFPPSAFARPVLDARPEGRGERRVRAYVSCPCSLAVSQPLNASAHTVDILVRTAGRRGTMLPQTRLNVSVRDADYRTATHAVHTLRVPTFARLRVDVVSLAAASVRVVSTIRSDTCPSLLPEHSVGDAVERQRLMPRVVGGDSAHRELVPYLARITSPSEERENLWLMCSGVMISPIHVLTAAHCLPSTESTVYIGLSDNSDMSITNAYSVETVDIPPEFLQLDDDSRRFRYDIAVITLIPNGRDETFGDGTSGDTNSTDTPKWMKVNINNDVPQTWSIVRVAGYGSTNGDMNAPSNSIRALYQVDLPIVSAEYCKPLYGGAVDYNYQLCAGYVGQGGCDSW